MNQSVPEPHFELPVPVSEGTGNIPHGRNPEHFPEQAVAPPVVSSPVISQPQPVAPTQSLLSVGPVTPAAPAVADDSDLIEKEWVQKAKEIVAGTRDDPHQQNKQMSLIRADYMKKRYNKNIKIEEA